MDLIVTFLAAQQLAITHLSPKFADFTGVDRNEFAESFRKSADLINLTKENRDIFNIILNKIASDIEASSLHNTQNIEEKIKKLLH